MRIHRSMLIAACITCALVLLLPAPAAAQESKEPTEGVNSGNYNIKQTIEFGGQVTDRTGNRSTYDTFVHRRDGVRLYEHTFEMRSLNHQGWLFDDFFVNSYGYGGEPNSVTRLRAYKNKWYNLSATFRRDYNYWDYNLLANPLNPNTAVANAPAGFTPIVTTSPHSMQLVRRLGDYNLTILPQSRVRFRVGYSRNVSEGPSYTSFHEGTDVLLFQNWKTTLNSYQFGVDFKLLPKTNISFDQFFQYYKGDTSWVDNAQAYLLPTGIPAGLIDLGLPFNTAANQPCAAPFVAPVPPNTIPTVNPACNGYQVYNSVARQRNSYPTTQLTLQSNPFEKFDFSGRFAYSSTDGDTPIFNEFFQGLVTRTRARQFNIFGPSEAKRVSVTVDLAATFTATEHLRFQNTFHFTNFRLPARWDQSECSFFGTSLAVAPPVFTPVDSVPLTCTPPAVISAGQPQHGTSSGADIISWQINNFLGQATKTNLFEVLYDFNKQFGGHLGYRYAHRTIREYDIETGDFVFFPTLPNTRNLPAPFSGPCPVANNRADGSCRVQAAFADAEEEEINEHSALIGVWARPSDTLRFVFDTELFSADRSFTRISPRQWQRFKFRSTYKPRPWATITGNINANLARNNVFQINHRRHTRSFGVGAIFAPEERWSLDFGYDYSSVFSATNICYVLTGVPLPPGATTPCPSGGAAPISGISLYKNNAHFGHVDFVIKPVKRVTASVGYAGTTSNGNTTFINPIAPPGPLRINYHLPTAQVIVDLYKGLAWKVGWNYYNYNEKADVDPTGSRDFRSHAVTLAIRYSF